MNAEHHAVIVPFIATLGNIFKEHDGWWQCSRRGDRAGVEPEAERGWEQAGEQDVSSTPFIVAPTEPPEFPLLEFQSSSMCMED